jgi:hypothetical protein
MPRFHVYDSFSINDKFTFVLVGLVLEGYVVQGMAVSIPFNGNARMRAQIDRIENIHRPEGEVVCLCIDCSVPDEIVLWEALNIKNRTIEIAMA